MQTIEDFKTRFSKTCLARWWHRYAPPLLLRRQYYDKTIFMNLRDNIFYFSMSTPELEKYEENVMSVLEFCEGPIWDVGANVGLFSVRASLFGLRCVAFELSPVTCRLLQKTKEFNHLDFDIIEQPFTLINRSYLPPKTASAENKVTFVDTGDYKTITYQEAHKFYGLPALIKMDIEGGEAEFFNSVKFKKWLLDYSIAWLVEVHHEKLGFLPEWQDVPHAILQSNHYLYCKDSSKLDRLTECSKYG
jgi:FkbM family methyltransferase